MRSALCAALTAVALVAVGGAFAPARARADIKLQVRVDRKSLTLDDTLTLQVSVESRGAQAPDVQMPQLDGFDIVSQQVQRPMQFSFNFGQGAVVQSQVVYTFTLRPTRVGAITIKPVAAELDGERRASSPLTITVSQGSGTPPGDPGADPSADRDDDPQAAGDQPPANAASNGGLDLAQVDGSAFIRAVADKATPYVGEQVTVTIYLYTRESLRAPPVTEIEPTTDGFWVHDLLENSQAREQRQVVQGAVYAVYPLRRFAAFPLRSGELTIGPMALRIDTSSVFDVFGGRRGNPGLSRKGSPLEFQVKPLPERKDVKGEPVVGRFEVQSKIDRAQTATGDAVTLTVVVRGQGNIRDVKFDKPVIPGLDVLEPDIKDLIEAPNDRVGGTRELRYLIVPREPGRYTLPAFELTQFDPQTERYSRVASTPMTLEVVGNALAANPATAGTPQAQDGAKDEPAPKPKISALDWRPIRTESALERRHALIAEQPWFIPGLALPALLYAAWLGVRSKRKRMHAQAQTAQSRAEREAKSRLDAAVSAASHQDGKAFFAAAAAAVLATLEARLGEPATGLTHGELRRHLVERGMSEPLAREVTGLLERADHQRFGGASSAAALDAELGALKSACDKLAGFRPRAKEAA